MFVGRLTSCTRYDTVFLHSIVLTNKTSISGPPPAEQLDHLWRRIRVKRHSLRIEQQYVYRVRFFIRFHRLRYPAEMGVPEIVSFWAYLANDRQGHKSLPIGQWLHLTSSNVRSASR